MSEELAKWARVPTELMETLIPEGVEYSTIFVEPATEETEAVTRQKTLREFVFPHCTHDLQDGTTIFQLACNQKAYGRDIGVNDDDHAQWNSYLSAYGDYGSDSWFDRDGKNSLIAEIGEVI
jgi:hypothetical protein